MDRWDIFIVCVAGYVAIMALVRLMTGRRNQLISQVREQMADMQKKKRNPKRKKLRKAESQESRVESQTFGS